ncbi:MAG: hypothetical protein JJU46_03530 [Balneolaceae bacterium]|nr:hypothetical protein [Balneolaceae bacterium]MCH8547366.1 hypothetical protein [Balneolaceae bacterium]
MKTGQEVNQDQINRLIEDAAYLQDEAEALTYVISQVPYDTDPPDGLSIYSMLRLVDHAQKNYFRPKIEKVFSENRTVILIDKDHYSQTFEKDVSEEKDVQRVLRKIIKHRAALLNVIKKIPLIDWERILQDENGEEITLYQFAGRMVEQERRILKEIADLVLIHQNEKLSRREIDSRVEQRKSQQE